MSRRLKNWLDAYLAYTELTEAPQHFHFWAGIAAIAGALRRKVYMDQLYFRWSPNFYIIFVAPSGIATKSTAMDNAMDLLRKVDGIYLGPNTMTWQALVQELQRVQEEVLTPDGDFETQSCLTFASRELGSLIDFHDKKLIDVLVDLWDGKTEAWRKATQTYGDQITTNPWLNIAACTTPKWIAENLPSIAIGGGFTSRCLFVYGDKKKQLIAYPKRSVQATYNSRWFQELQADLIHDLGEIASISGEYVLTKEAENYGIEWYEELYKNPPRHLLLGNFDGYIARKQSHIHRVAVVLAAAYKNDRVLELDDLLKAIQLVDSLEPQMAKSFGYAKMDANASRIDDIIQIMRIYKKMSRTSLYRIAFTRYAINKKDFDDIISSACEAGMLNQGANLTLFLREPENQDQTLDTEEEPDEPEEAQVL